MTAARERILAPDYLGDLTAKSIDEVRAMRTECQGVETSLSYLRRMVQGRLDIVGVELQRRAEGGDPTDLPDLISRLPETLADRTRTPGFGRLPQQFEPDEVEEDLEAELDAIVHPGELTNLPEVGDAELRELTDRLEAFEQRVSADRRVLFERLDALQAEITRRYKSGEVTVDALLSEG